MNPLLEAYFAAGNTRDAEAFVACFVPDAVVVDESKTYSGLDEIRQWFHQTRAEYNFTAEPKSSSTTGDETVVTCTVSGTFPGSPLDISYRFKLRKGMIAELTIV